MTLTQKDTKTLVKEVVKALDPKFKSIDKRFKKLSIEIGDMIAPLATKHELNVLVNELTGLNGRVDDLEERFHEFAGSVGVFESRVIQRFDDIDEKLQEHDTQFGHIIEHLGKHSAQLRNHETRITRLETNQ